MKFNKKLLYYPAVILYGIILMLILVGKDNLFGSNIDWLPQHSVFPEAFRQNFYESKQLIPNFIFNIGGGQNVFNFIYYGFLSPFVLLSYFFPFVGMNTYIMVAGMIIYLMTGVLAFVFLKHHFDEKISFIAALIYMSMSPLTYHFHHHIMFVWYLPFVIMGLMGIDRYFEKKKCGFFIISTFLLILTNYYFSVGSLVCLFVYAIYRVLGDDSLCLKMFFKKFLGLVYLFIIPVLMSCFVLLPTAYTLVVNGRTFQTGEPVVRLIVPLLSEVFFGTYGMGITGLMLVALIGNLICSKFKKSEIFLNGFLVFIIICPFFSYLLNGLLYTRAKVLIPFIILILYCLCSFVDNIREDKVNHKFLCLGTAAFVVLSVLLDFHNVYVGLAICASLCAVLLLRKYPYALMAGTLSILIVTTFTNNFKESYVSKQYYANLKTDEIQRLLNESQHGLYRTNVRFKEHDAANRIYRADFYNNSVYSSTSNSLYQEFYKNCMGNEDAFRNCFITSGATNELFHTFMGTKYMLSPTDPGLYYEKVRTGNGINLYENKYAYPVIYKSKSLIGEKQLSEVSFPYLSEYLMTHTVVDGDYKSAYESVITDCNVPQMYDFVIDEPKQYTIELDEKYRNKVIYLSFDVQNEGDYVNEEDLSIVINGVMNKLTARDWQYYNGNTRFDYVLPMEGKTKLIVNISAGKFRISNLKMYFSDIIAKDYAEADDISIDKFHDTISCSVKADKGDYLVTSIPFDEGFSSFVNGEEVKTELVNKAFVGVPLKEGNNSVIIKYRAPLFDIGVTVSLLGLILLLYELTKKFIFDFIKNNREICMYLIFGVLTTVVSILTYAACTRSIFSSNSIMFIQTANIISWVAAVTFAYVTNKIFVFRSNNRILPEIIKFFSSRIGTLIVEMLLMYGAVTLVGINDLAAKIFVQIVVIVSNYVLSKLLVFKK